MPFIIRNTLTDKFFRFTDASKRRWSDKAERTEAQEFATRNAALDALQDNLSELYNLQSGERVPPEDEALYELDNNYGTRDATYYKVEGIGPDAPSRTGTAKTVKKPQKPRGKKNPNKKDKIKN